MAKKKGDVKGIVYSTDPGYTYEEEVVNVETLLPGKQPLRIRLDNKQRGGKTVTLVTGFVGKESDLAELGRQLRSYCGTGGAVKEGEIIVQGDQREKVWQWLVKQGYGQSKKL